MGADDRCIHDISNESAVALSVLEKISFGDAVADPHVQSEFFSYLANSNSKDFSKLLFLVSVEEFKKMCVVQVNEEEELERTSSSSSLYALKMINKYMTEDCFLDIGSGNLTILNNSVSSYGRILEKQLKLSPSASASIDLFKDVELAVKTSLYETFLKFRNSSRVSEQGSISFSFHEILFDREMCSIFWIYLFTERMHQSLSLWMEIEYILKPCFEEHELEFQKEIQNYDKIVWKIKEFWLIAGRICNQYIKIGAASEIPAISDLERNKFEYLYRFIKDAITLEQDSFEENAKRAQELIKMLEILQGKIEANLQVNHYIKFVSSKLVKDVTLLKQEKEIEFQSQNEKVEKANLLKYHQPKEIMVELQPIKQIQKEYFKELHVDDQEQKNKISLSTKEGVQEQVTVYLPQEKKRQENGSNQLSQVDETMNQTDDEIVITQILKELQQKIVETMEHNDNYHSQDHVLDSHVDHVASQDPNGKLPETQLNIVMHDESELHEKVERKKERQPHHQSKKLPDNSCCLLVDILHSLNIPNHQAQRKVIKHELENLINSQNRSIIAVVSFSMNQSPNEDECLLTSKCLFCSEDDGFSIPEHLDRFFIPSGPQVIEAKSQPTTMLFNLTCGSSDQLYYAACLTRYCLLDSNNKKEFKRAKQKNTKYYIPAGLCILSKFPLLNTLRNRLRDFHLQHKTDVEYSTQASWQTTAEQLTQLTSPCSPNFRNLSRLSCAPCPYKASSPSGTCFCCSPIDFSLESLFGCIDIGNVVNILTVVSESLKLLILPFVWSHVYAPVLPRSMMSCLDCPTPCIFGLHSSYAHQEAETVLPSPSDEVVLVYLDKNQILGGGKLKLPVDVDIPLSEKLFVILRPKIAFSDRIMSTKKDTIFPENEVRKIFAHAIQQLLDLCLGFRFLLADENDSVVVFDEQTFLNSFSNQQTQQFFKVFCKTQAFSQRIATCG